MINDKQKQLLKLVLRSRSDADGWYSVSETVWPLFDDAGLDELLVREKLEKGGRLRITERGQTIIDYLV